MNAFYGHYPNMLYPMYPHMGMAAAAATGYSTQPVRVTGRAWPWLLPVIMCHTLLDGAQARNSHYISSRNLLSANAPVSSLR